MIKPLIEVLGHAEDEVVRIAGIKLGLPVIDAQELFQETKKFLWLQAVLRLELELNQPELPRGVFIFDALKPIDEMWHQFILCTMSYTAFCDRFLGGYLHHQPLSLVELYANSSAIESRAPELRATIRAELALQCRYIARKLGKDTLEYWYRGLTNRYPQVDAVGGHPESGPKDPLREARVPRTCEDAPDLSS